MKNWFRFGCLIGLLVVSAADLRWMPRARSRIARSDVAMFPMQLAGWSGRNLPDMTVNEKRALAADRYLIREYNRTSDEASVILFVAYYVSQRSGDAIHSPRNCLPGAGWAPVSSEVVEVPGGQFGSSHFPANHYVIEKDGMQQDVLYWYQAGRRKYASEYLGKVYLAWDAATESRTDGALIRITTDRSGQSGESLENLLSFEKVIEPALSGFLQS